MSKTRKELAALTCIPCRGGIPPLAEIKVKEMIRSVPGWLRKRNGADKIEKEYTFRDFEMATVSVQLMIHLLCSSILRNQMPTIWIVSAVPLRTI